METVIIGRTEAKDDSDRFDVLDDVIERAGFWDRLEERLERSERSKADFLVAIKPNLMMFYSRADMSVITEPALVEHLIDRLIDRGFTNVALVESQNVYGNWFENREVTTVAQYAGYRSTNYRIVDLTEEAVPHRYGRKLDLHSVGRTWRDADFRISFAKNKTHFSSYYTLTIKNIYGVMPEQDKFREYHRDREVPHVTTELLDEFPVHFGIVDGVWSADGLLGIKSDLKPEHTKTIIAGSNLLAVDVVGGRKMGLDPMKNVFVRHAIKEFGRPEIRVEGDEFVYENWDNVPPGVDHLLNYGEEWYGFSNLMGFLSSEMDPAFPMKPRYRIAFALRRSTLSLLKLVAKLDR
jgi:uncharacterized protein (DUF362 family)